MANLYRVFNPVDNVDVVNKIKTLADDIGLPCYVRSDRAVNDLLVFTCNTNQLVYLYVASDMDVFIEPLSSSDDMTILNYQNTQSYAWGHAISEVHMFGYDNPKSIYILMKRSDGVWMQICMGYCHPIGVHAGCFVASCNFNTYDGYSGADIFPAGYGNSTNWVVNPLFGSYDRWGEGAGYVNVDIGNNATEHWHKLTHVNSGNCAACPLTYYLFNDGSDLQSSFGYRKLQAARQGFGWNTHLMSVPFLVRDPDGYWIPVGYAPNIRAVKSGEHTVFDKMNSAGTDFWIFPWSRNTPSASGTVSSLDQFWAFEIFAGQETPVLL